LPPRQITPFSLDVRSAHPARGWPHRGAVDKQLSSIK
jgi:hypothetical protein